MNHDNAIKVLVSAAEALSKEHNSAYWHLRRVQRAQSGAGTLSGAYGFHERMQAQDLGRALGEYHRLTFELAGLEDAVECLAVA